MLQQLRREKRRVELHSLSPALQQARLEAIAWAEQHGQAIFSQIDGAKAVVRSEGFFDPAEGLETFIILTEGLRLASVPHYPSELRLLGYGSAYPVDASQGPSTGLSVHDIPTTPLAAYTVFPTSTLILPTSTPTPIPQPTPMLQPMSIRGTLLDNDLCQRGTEIFLLPVILSCIL